MELDGKLLLGSNFPDAGWPACGEIDVMEAVGTEPAVNLGSLHGSDFEAVDESSLMVDPNSGAVKPGSTSTTTTVACSPR